MICMYRQQSGGGSESDTKRCCFNVGMDVTTYPAAFLGTTTYDQACCTGKANSSGVCCIQSGHAYGTGTSQCCSGSATGNICDA